MIPSTNNPFQSDVSELANEVSSGGHVTFYGLEPNTKYGIYCEIYHGSTFLKDLTGWVTTTDEDVGGGDIGGGDVTSFTVTVYFNDKTISSTKITTPSGSYTGYYGEDIYSTSVPLYSAVIIKANPAKDCSFFRWVYRYVNNGKETDQLHDENDTFYYDGSDGDLIIRAEGKIDETEITVPKWSWKVSNGDATDEQTAKAYDALIHNGPTKDFSHEVWNDMVAVVREILYQTDDKWDGKYATPNQTKMGADKTLTATRFNSLLYNIDSRYDTGLKEVSPGDVVKASYFLTLAECINDWIDSL